MASTPTRTSNQLPPRRDGLDDTVPASDGEDGFALANEPAPEPAPERYKLGNELGRGGMGRVVEAYDTQLHRTVAFKEVLPKTGSGTARRFSREIHITARLEHASIVPLYDSGVSADGRPFYVMRRVSGRPLDEMIARERSLGERLTLLPALLAAIDAVAHAHTRNVIHRDLKPANILLGELGETVVIDWGLAKVIGEEDEDGNERTPTPGDSLRTQMGSVFGTPGFMAPEQARGEELGLHGDVYALGACLYQLLSGTSPVAGVSATEVMDKTRTHDIQPLAVTAPGAPPELVAIVGKALSFDPNERYPHAGALGEDVRRFLAGQLVAAHSYTNRQKLARFARRHRAALAVAALAAVAVAVMAWIGVHRIITERDAANTARQDAVAGKREAEETRDRLAERHDALIVMQANALLESNPSEALAILKQLSARSPRLAEARALAAAASLRGTAWAMQSTNEFTTMVGLDPTAKQLVQVSRDGMVRVFDLERRRLVVARPFSPFTRAIWVMGGRLLVTHDKSPPQLLDPTSNTMEELAIDPIENAMVTANGDRVVFVTPTHTAAVLDIATHAVTPLKFEDKVSEVAIASDGSWIAIVGKQLLVVTDHDGKELTRRAGEAVFTVGSRHRSLAVLAGDNKVFECHLDPQPVWTEVPVEVRLPHRVISILYRGSELEMIATNGDVLAWRGKVVFVRNHVERMDYQSVEAGDGVLVTSANDGKLHWANEFARGTLAFPSVMSHPRIAARAGSSRVVVAGDGIVVVFDLAAVTPQRIDAPFGTQAVFVDDDTLLVIRTILEKWQWIDLATNKTTEFSYELRGIPPVLWDVDRVGGRVLVRDATAKGDRFNMLHKGSSAITTVIEGHGAIWARLIPGDGVIYGVGDGRVFAQIGTQPAREVAKVDGISVHGVGLGNLRFAAHGSTGEIVRVDLATNKLDRVRVPIGSDGFLASDNNGHVLIAEDNRLLMWDGSVTELAKFDKKIQHLDPVDGGIAVQLGGDHEVQVIELRPGAVPHRVLPSTKTFVAISEDGKLMAGLGNGQLVTIVELPSRARWTLPILYSAQELLQVAPNARKIMQGTDHALAIWRLPMVGPDFGAWLDNETNATIDTDGVLAWPWQTPRAP
jgi:hypothetical protein